MRRTSSARFLMNFKPSWTMVVPLVTPKWVSASFATLPSISTACTDRDVFRQYWATEPPPRPTTKAFLALSLREDAVLWTTQPRNTACSGAPILWTPMTPPLFTRYRRSPSSTTRGAPHDRVVEKSVAAPAIKAAASMDLSGSPEGGGASSFVVSLVVLPLPLLLPPFFFCFVGIAVYTRCALAALTHLLQPASTSPTKKLDQRLRQRSSACLTLLSKPQMLQRWRCGRLRRGCELAACNTLASSRVGQIVFFPVEGLGRRARRVLRAKLHLSLGLKLF